MSGTSNVIGKLRQQGYEDTMRAAGLGEHIRVESGDFTEDAGYRATVRLLNSAEPPTAIFAVDRDGPGFSFTATSQPGPPGGYGTWRLRTPGGGPDLLVTLDPITTEPCDHRYQAQGHDPGVRLRHLSQVRHATCTGPTCRRPASQCDFEHNVAFEAGARTCLCNGGPKCRHDHRLKQHPRWKTDQLPDGTFRLTTPSGRTYTSEPTRYPI